MHLSEMGEEIKALVWRGSLVEFSYLDNILFIYLDNNKI